MPFFVPLLRYAPTPPLSALTTVANLSSAAVISAGGVPDQSPAFVTAKSCVYNANLSIAPSTVVGLMPSHDTPSFAGYGIAALCVTSPVVTS